MVPVAVPPTDASSVTLSGAVPFVGFAESDVVRVAGVETLIVALSVAVPPAPVHAKVYVLFALTVSDFDPEVPVQFGGVTAQLAALLEVQLIPTEAPEETLTGPLELFAFISAAGSMASGGSVGWPALPELTEIAVWLSALRAQSRLTITFGEKVMDSRVAFS